jgi:uncharacterized membrane protein
MTYTAPAAPSGWAWLAMAMSVLLLAGLSVGAYLLIFRSGGRAAPRTAAERRLTEQFARGQITQQEYHHLRASLDALREGRRRGVRTPSSSGRRLRGD